MPRIDDTPRAKLRVTTLRATDLAQREWRSMTLVQKRDQLPHLEPTFRRFISYVSQCADRRSIGIVHAFLNEEAKRTGWQTRRVREISRGE